MVPILKNKKQSLCNSDNYRAIALSIIIGKILDYVGGMGYAHDIKCPSLNGIQQMVDMCVDYAGEYNIKFNGSKSHMLLFKGRQCKDSKRTLIIDGVTIHCSESVCDLDHNISTNDKDGIAKSAKASFWRSFNLFRSDLGHFYSFYKI